MKYKSENKEGIMNYAKAERIFLKNHPTLKKNGYKIDLLKILHYCH